MALGEPRVASLLRNPYLLGYLALYMILLSSMVLVGGFSPLMPLFVLAVIGLGFSALAWWSTRRSVADPIEVRRPAAETLVLVAWLVVIGVFLVWGLPAARALETRGWPAGVPALLAKLAVLVVAPFLLLAALSGYRIGDFLRRSPNWRSHALAVVSVSAAFIAFQLLVGRGPRELRESGLSPAALLLGLPLAYAWLLAEVGLVEEFFFRALLQARLAALLRSELSGIVVMALAFGLAHAPGLYLRPEMTLEGVGASPSLLVAVGYSIVVTSVTSFFLGVLWARTRNLLALMMVHAAGDLVPNLAELVSRWLPT